ncbi:MAG: oxidative damage protection protein [Gammaproteobacteria bacterium]|nr:oxidative damage protection protein [Gammaproteobacteria bacterium]
MTKMVHCVKLGIEAEGMDRAPYPGDLGQQILNNICKQAWQQWVSYQTMLINENRLSVIDPKHRRFLEVEMKKFLFDGSEQMPEGYTPPKVEN